tara:strand:+ start:111 stop:569 length:459 start_codon:yes stop_codon:yes gene_type:complete
MKIINIGTANSLSSKIDGLVQPGRRTMATAKRFVNAVCILRSGGKPYMKITIKNSSTAYRGMKGNDLSFHAVYNSNRYFMEIHDSKSNTDRFGPRLNSGTNKDSIQDMVDKANSNSTWNPHFTFSVIQDADDVTFDADFDGRGTRFRGGRGR